MHLSENEGIEGKSFVVTGGVGFVGSALCIELIRRGAARVTAFDLVSDSSSSRRLIQNGVKCIQGCYLLFHYTSYVLMIATTISIA